MAGSLKGTGIKGGTEAKLDTWRTLPIDAAGDRRIRPYAISWPLQYCHYQPASEGKTELCVKRGSYRIITKQVQKMASRRAQRFVGQVHEPARMHDHTRGILGECTPQKFL